MESITGFDPVGMGSSPIEVTKNILMLPISSSDIDFLCYPGIPIVERNKIHFKCLEGLIRQGNIQRIRGLMIQMNQRKEVHPSLLMSTLIMTSNIAELAEVNTEMRMQLKQKLAS